MNALKKQTPPGNGGAAVATFNEKPFDRLKRIKIKTAQGGRVMDAFVKRCECCNEPVSWTTTKILLGSMPPSAPENCPQDWK
jgi:hypothetical protein